MLLELTEMDQVVRRNDVPETLYLGDNHRWRIVSAECPRWPPSIESTAITGRVSLSFSGGMSAGRRNDQSFRTFMLRARPSGVWLPHKSQVWSDRKSSGRTATLAVHSGHRSGRIGCNAFLERR